MGCVVSVLDLCHLEILLEIMMDRMQKMAYSTMGRVNQALL